MVGTAGIRDFGWTESAARFIEPVYNLQPNGAYPGELGIPVAGVPFIVITTGIRSNGDYGVSAVNVSPQAGLNHVRLTLWGVPADPSHDILRGKRGTECTGELISSQLRRDRTRCEHECETVIGRVPYRPKSNRRPSSPCPPNARANPLTVRGSYNAWQAPGQYAKDSAELPAVDGCNELSFEPTIEARPTTNLADAPSGLEFNLHVPQNEDPEGVATPELKEAVVKLPAGPHRQPRLGRRPGRLHRSPDRPALRSPRRLPRRLQARHGRSPHAAAARTAQGLPLPGDPHQNPSGSLLAGYIVPRRPGDHRSSCRAASKPTR